MTLEKKRILKFGDPLRLVTARWGTGLGHPESLAMPNSQHRLSLSVAWPCLRTTCKLLSYYFPLMIF